MPALIPSPLRRTLKRTARRLVARLLRAPSGQRVMSGPFRGMRVPEGADAGMMGRFLLGTHELELAPALERLAASGLRTIVNLGAAQGYYAVGLALRCPDAQVTAFEATEAFHPFIERAAVANGVADRIAVRGMCDAVSLAQCVRAGLPPALVLADIDGAELAVFDERAVAALVHAAVLIETHDRRAPGTTERLLARFGKTHRVEVYLPRSRRREDIPAAVRSGGWRALSWLLLWEMKEGRVSDQRWLLFIPRGAIP